MSAIPPLSNYTCPHCHLQVDGLLKPTHRLSFFVKCPICKRKFTIGKHGMTSKASHFSEGMIVSFVVVVLLLLYVKFIG